MSIFWPGLALCLKVNPFTPGSLWEGDFFKVWFWGDFSISIGLVFLGVWLFRGIVSFGNSLGFEKISPIVFIFASFYFGILNFCPIDVEKFILFVSFTGENFAIF